MNEKVIQFGEGNFLRGFVDYFLFKLTEQGLFDGKVVVVQPIAEGLVSVLNEQRGKYNLYLRGVENGVVKTEHSHIDVISRGINPYTDFEAYLALADNPDFRFIISNTTEAGIAYDPSCNFSDAPPSSFPAKLTRLLYRRYENGLPGFILLACELIDKNGAELKKCVLRYAEQWDLGDGFSAWINDENTFADTLVDRIVTGFPYEEAKELCFGDRLLDTAELFHLWVIEGNFEDELPLVTAGFNVVWTDDVTPYKKRKVRILNGAHTSMVTGALLMGLSTVGECLEDKTVCAYLEKCLFEEILPTIGDTADNRAFATAVLERFRNPFIRHLLRSIALNSVSKFAVRVLPTIREYKAQRGAYPPALTLSLSLLIAFYKNDMPQDLPEVTAFLKTASVTQILGNTALWGEDISELSLPVGEGLERINAFGARTAAEWLLKN